MARSHTTAQSVQLAAARAAAKDARVERLANPTRPPTVEEFWSRTWYALFTFPNQEYQVKTDLESMGFSVFLPVRARWTGLRFRTKRAREYPLLVRYAFVGVVGGQRALDHGSWSDFQNVEGVKAVLGTSHGPLEVPRENLIALAGEIISGAYDETRDVWSADEEVMITTGVFQGFDGRVKDTVPSTANPDDAIPIIVRIFGRDTITHIPLAELQRLR